MTSYPPSVNELAEFFSDSGLPHPILVKEIRNAIDEGDWENLDARIKYIKTLPLQTVINATGVLLHTNLGQIFLVLYRKKNSSFRHYCIQ